MQGPQTAVVVGPAGEEIYTDKYGRVKVQFHWDREGKKKDENSSCWVRVSQPWAGKSWGGVAIPRIGQEVIVDFLEGDPDQPIITGRVYNAEQMPPYDAAGQQDAERHQEPQLARAARPPTSTRSASRTRRARSSSSSTPRRTRTSRSRTTRRTGSATTARRRSTTTRRHHVKHDRTETVDNNETITIGGNRTRRDVAKDETITIGKNRTERVGKNETIDDRQESLRLARTRHRRRTGPQRLGGQGRVDHVSGNRDGRCHEERGRFGRQESSRSDRRERFARRRQESWCWTPAIRSPFRPVPPASR